MPIYEYRCEECGRRSSALLKSYADPDPACPSCGSARVGRLVSTFATVRSDGDGDGDGFDGFGDGDDGGDGEDGDWGEGGGGGGLDGGFDDDF